MGRLFNNLIDFYTTDEWPFEQFDEEFYLLTAFQGVNGEWSCLVQALEDREQCVFYSICPFNVAEHKRHTMAEFLTRINYGLVIGNFEMNYDDGEIRYKTSIDATETELTAVLIKQMTYTNLVITDKFLPSLYSVASGNSTVQAEIEYLRDL